MNSFQKLTIIGLVGLTLLIIGECIHIIILKIIGIIFLAVTLITNTKIINHKLEKLEGLGNKNGKN